MYSEGYFNVAERNREKQASRERDELCLEQHPESAQQIAMSNGFFCALDNSSMEIVERRVAIRLG